MCYFFNIVTFTHISHSGVHVKPFRTKVARFQNRFQIELPVIIGYVSIHFFLIQRKKIQDIIFSYLQMLALNAIYI